MTELAVPSAGHLTGWGTDLVVAAQIAEKVAGTEFVPTAMRGKPDVVVAAILYGAELGIDPMTALQSIHVVEGRPAPSAELMRALIFRAGHTFTVHEMSGTRCRVSGLRVGQSETERYPIEWTLDMARAAGLLGRTNWQRYPRAMLLARATSDLARAIFPDVVKGLGYIAEDLDQAAMLDSWGPPETGQGPEPAKPRKALQRARRPKRDTPIETAAELPPVAPPLVDPQPAEVPPQAPTAPPPQSYAQEEQLPLEVEPEPGPPEPPPPGQLIGSGPLRALQAGLTRQLGTVATREEKHALLAAIIGHPVESAKDLTRAEGMRALDWMGRLNSGEATLVMSPEGHISVLSNEEPPAEEEPPEEGQ